MDIRDADDKPFYQHAWFWVVVAFGIIGIIVAVVVIPMVTASKLVADTTSTIVQQAQVQTSEQKNVNLGESFTVDGVEYTITSVDRKYSTGNQFAAPSDGKEFVKLNISAINKSNEKKSYNSYYWKIEDSNGDITSYAMLAQADDALSSGELAAGGTKKASIVFEVPANSSLKAHVQTSVFGNDEIVVNL